MYQCNHSSTQPQAEYDLMFGMQPSSLPYELQHQQTDGQDALKHRIKAVRKVLENLRLKLSIEKSNLAKERWETTSMSSTMVPFENRTVVEGSFHSLPVNYQNYGYNNTLNPNCEDNVPPGTLYNNYETVHTKNDPYSNQRFNYLINPVVPATYQDQLQHVERLCHEEFCKMQESISGLRKIKGKSGDDESDNSDNDNALHSKYHRRSHNKHHRAGQYDHHRRRRSKYILPLNEHCKHSPFIYDNKGSNLISRGDNNIAEYLGDSRDAGGVAEWYCGENPCEFHYRQS